MKITELGLRLKLLLLVFVSVLPIIFLIFYNFGEQKKIIEENAKQDLLESTKIASLEYKRFIDEGRQLLEIFSNAEELKDLQSAKCSEFLSQQLARFPRYVNFAVTNTRGEVICSAIPTLTPVNNSDRLFFQKAMELKGFAVGEYEVGKITQKRSINFGFPLTDTSGEIYAVLYSALDLNWLENLTAGFVLPKNSAATLIDGNGTILIRNPNNEEWVGKSIKETKLYDSIRNKDEGFVETEGLDEVLRLYAFSSLNNISGDNSVFSIGISKNEIFKSSETLLKNNILLLAVITFFAIFVSQIIGQALVVRTVQQLKELDKLKDEFLSLASHQLRTPLTAIRWNLELLLRNAKENQDADSKKLLNKAYESTVRMVDLIKSLLNITRIESGRINISPSPTNIKTLVEQIIEEVKPLSSEKNISINLDFDPSVKEVKVDEKLLSQIYTNLLTNSIKYSKSNTSISVEISSGDKYITSKIQDAGLGIPQNQQSRIFQKFFRGDNVQRVSTEGSGLGLYLVKLITDLLGGIIWFESSESKGTTFWFTIPVKGSVERTGQISLE